MWDEIKLKNPIWHIDATGSIHKKLNQQKAPFLYSTVSHDRVKKQIIPVFEFITTVHTSESIAKHLKYAIERIEQVGTKKPFLIAPIIVMDFSFAIINAVMATINKHTLTEYIQYCFDLLIMDKKNLKTIKTIVYLCSTHFLKSIIKKTKPLFNSAGKIRWLVCQQDSVPFRLIPLLGEAFGK